MSKDIRIELLQNRENVRIGEQMLSNSEFSNSTGWTSPALSSTDAFTFTSGRMEKNTTGLGAARATILCDFVEGYEYQIRVAVKEYNRNGQLLLANHGEGNANIPVLSSTIVPSGGAGTGSDYGYYTTNWVQGSSNLTKLSVYANDGVKLKLSYIRIYRTAVDKSSVYGTLDASTTEDFPLSITFSVNDPSNIDARKGSYSKTFEVPASKNNNQVLKNFNIANSTHNDAQLYNKIPCRILTGNLFSLTGLLQIKEVQRLNDKAISYSCVFLGDNLAWSTLMDAKYLNELQLENSTDLKLSAKNIIASWSDDDATTTTSPVTYPVTSYGRICETCLGYGDGIQMFREQWEIDYMLGDPYNISETGFLGNSFKGNNPVLDWRPLVWIYNMINKIFTDVGYKISSNFIESGNFKKLLYATPNFLYNNPNERKTNNTYIGNFKDDSTCPATSANIKIFDETAQWNFNVPNSSATITEAFTNQTPYPPIRFGGTCGSGDGSGRFQPAPNVITTSAGQQQDLTISTAAVGNEWYIPAAGYYTVTTSNIMYYMTWAESDWTGSGNITNNTTSGMKPYGNLIVECKRVGQSDWNAISAIDNQSATILGPQTFYDNNHDYAFGGTFPTNSSTHYLNEGDRLRMSVGVAPIVTIVNPAANYTGTTSVNVRTELFGTSYDDNQNYNAANSLGQITIELINEDTPVWGGVYDLQNVLPTDQKQLDFVKGVAHAFNLQFYTDESSKTVYMEPYSDFYLPPKDAKDWSHKLARNLSDTQSFLDNNWTRKLIFKYKTDDKDWRVNHMSELYFDDIGDIYPEQVNLPNTYPAGETIFENPFFAGTYDSKNIGCGGTVDGDNFYTAALWEATYWNSSQKGYGFKPRMLFYNKMTMPVTHSPLWQGFNVEMGMSFSNHNFSEAVVQMSDVTAQPQNWYPNNFLNNAKYTSATFYNRYDYSNQFGLTYGNYWAKDYDPSTNTTSVVGDQVGRGLYDRYYKPMIEGLQARPKMRICYLDLKITDIINLDFRKMVYIDGVYYRIVKVIDYMPHKNQPTKVELHQWSPNEGSSLPTSGVWINNNTSGDDTTTGGGGVGGDVPDDPVLGF